MSDTNEDRGPLVHENGEIDLESSRGRRSRPTAGSTSETSRSWTFIDLVDSEGEEGPDGYLLRRNRILRRPGSVDRHRRRPIYLETYDSTSSSSEEANGPQYDARGDAPLLVDRLSWITRRPRSARTYTYRFTDDIEASGGAGGGEFVDPQHLDGLMHRVLRRVGTTARPTFIRARSIFIDDEAIGPLRYRDPNPSLRRDSRRGQVPHVEPLPVQEPVISHGQAIIVHEVAEPLGSELVSERPVSDEDACRLGVTNAGDFGVHCHEQNYTVAHDHRQGSPKDRVLHENTAPSTVNDDHGLSNQSVEQASETVNLGQKASSASLADLADGIENLNVCKYGFLCEDTVQTECPSATSHELRIPVDNYYTVGDVIERNFVNGRCGFTHPFSPEEFERDFRAGDNGLQNFQPLVMDIIISDRDIFTRDIQGRPKPSSNVRFNTFNLHCKGRLGDMILRVGNFQDGQRNEHEMFRFSSSVKLFERVGESLWEQTSCLANESDVSGSGGWLQARFKPWPWKLNPTERDFWVGDAVAPQSYYGPLLIEGLLLVRRKTNGSHDHNCPKLCWYPASRSRADVESCLADGDFAVKFGAANHHADPSDPRRFSVFGCAEIFQWVGGPERFWTFLGRDECFIRGGFDIGYQFDDRASLRIPLPKPHDDFCMSVFCPHDVVNFLVH